jgi:Domain of unknown function (DUF4386)
VSTRTAEHLAARVVGIAYLAALPLAIFPEFFVREKLIVFGDPAGTARNIVAHEGLFRLGIASNVLVFAVDAVLVCSLYVALRRVNEYLALLAASFRFMATVVLVFVVLADLEVLRVLASGGTASPSLLGAHGEIYNIGLLFFGFGSPLFCYLWLRSRYIPAALAVWGIIASALVGVCALLFVVDPALKHTITIAYYGGPIFLFELSIGLWLAIRGIPRPVEEGQVARA